MRGGWYVDEGSGPWMEVAADGRVLLALPVDQRTLGHMLE